MAVPRLQLTPPAGRSRRAVRISLALVVLTILGGGWYFVRESNRSEQRAAAMRLVTDRKYAEAIPALRQCLDADPDNPALLEALVGSLIKTDAPAIEVEPLVDRLCAVRPDYAEALRVRLDLRLKLGRKDEALADALRILELAPQDHAARRTAATLAVDFGYRDIAERELATLLASGAYPPHVSGTMLARMHWDAGRYAEAEAALDRYVPPHLDYPPGRALRGVLHYEAGRDEKAVELLKPIATSRGLDGQLARYYLALTLTRLGKKDEAAQLFAKLDAATRADQLTEDATRRPDDLIVQVQAARANLEAERPEVGRTLLEAVLKRLGPDREALRVLAECYDKLSQPDRAADARRRADAAPK